MDYKVKIFELSDLLGNLIFLLSSQARVDAAEDSISRAREGYRMIATRGAVCFDTTQYLREINPLYQTSFNQYLELYDAAIAHSDR